MRSAAICASIAFTLGSSSLAAAEDAKIENRFIELFSSEPATMLDLGLAKIETQLWSAEWPDRVQVVSLGTTVFQNPGAIFISIGLRKNSESEAECGDLWLFSRAASSGISAGKIDRSTTQICTRYLSNFFPAIPSTSVAKDWFLDEALNPCVITTISVSVSDANNSEREVCHGPFGAQRSDLTYTKKGP